MEKRSEQRENPRAMLEREFAGLDAWNKEDERQQKFSDCFYEMFTPGALDAKTKYLIGIAINLCNHCEYCIAYHTQEALKAGATREEILEAADVAVIFGGAPASAYGATFLREAIDTFTEDYGKE